MEKKPNKNLLGIYFFAGGITLIVLVSAMYLNFYFMKDSFEEASSSESSQFLQRSERVKERWGDFKNLSDQTFKDLESNLEQ